MRIYFFDTSALQYRYVQGTFTRLIRRLISDRRSSCYIADVTVLEISGALAKTCRREGWDVVKFDTFNDRFWADLAARRLKVCTTANRDLLRAKDLIRFAGVAKRKNLGSADALIAVCCLELALEKGEKVTFYLEDRKLYGTLKDVNAFQAGLKLRLLRN